MDVLRVAAEIEQVVLRQAEVLEQLPGRMLESCGACAALVGRDPSTAWSNVACASCQSMASLSCCRRGSFRLAI